MVQHCPLEPHACIAQLSPQGRLTIWTTTQGLYVTREQVAQALAEKIARNSPGAMMASKKAMWRSLDMGLRESLDMGIGLVTDFWGHPDDREGTVAFAEKREPRWAPPGKLQDKAQGKAREAES